MEFLKTGKKVERQDKASTARKSEFSPELKEKVFGLVKEMDDGRGLPAGGYYLMCGPMCSVDVSKEDFEKILDELCDDGRLYKYEAWNGAVLYTAKRPC